jgi:hypothetical protein
MLVVNKGINEKNGDRRNAFPNGGRRIQNYDHKRDENIREGLGITDIKTMI